MREMATNAATHSSNINYTNTLNLGRDIVGRGTAPSGGATPAPAHPENSAVSVKTMPTGDKLKAYAHTYFNDDLTEATNYLTTQGYK